MLKTGFVRALLLWLAFASHSLVAQGIEITPADVRTAARGPQAAYTGVGIAELLFLANDNIASGVGWVQSCGEFVDGSGGELKEHVTDAEYLAEPADQ